MNRTPESPAAAEAAERLRSHGGELYREGEKLRRDFERIASDANRATSTLREVLADVEDVLRVEMRRRPWVVLGAAALAGGTIGYVLPRWVLRAGIGVGKHVATTAAVQQIAAAAV